VLLEDAFEAEAEPKCRAPRRLVKGVALPFVSAIAQIFESVMSHEKHRLGSPARSLQTRRVKNVTYFDHAVRRLDPQIGGVSHGISGLIIENRKIERICGDRFVFDAGAKCFAARKRSVPHIIP
jgi:hypothetical protein